MIIHFFGCSFTAGDELADRDYPELLNHSDVPSYHEAKNKFVKSDAALSEEYDLKCRSMAYPAKLSKYGYDYVDHSINGASLEEMIYKIIITCLSKNKPDFVILQIPPLWREAVLLNKIPHMFSLKPGSVSFNGHDYDSYFKAKVANFGDDCQALKDMMLLSMLKGFLEFRKIPLILIDPAGEFDLKLVNSSDPFYSGLVEDVSCIELRRVRQITTIDPAERYCFAGHLSEVSHDALAEDLHIRIKFMLKNS